MYILVEKGKWTTNHCFLLAPTDEYSTWTMMQSAFSRCTISFTL